MKVLVVGATGSIGHLVVEEVIRQGHTVRALARDRHKARRLPKDAEVVVGDLTRLETLGPAVEGLDAIVFMVRTVAARLDRSRSTTAAFAMCWPR
jgi:uncharacterized protein YbjT (DUF2867 family)